MFDIIINWDVITIAAHCQKIRNILIFSFFLDNGPCLGYRPAPSKGYEWLTYKDVSNLLFRLFCANLLQAITFNVMQIFEMPTFKLEALEQ